MKNLGQLLALVFALLPLAGMAWGRSDENVTTCTRLVQGKPCGKPGRSFCTEHQWRCASHPCSCMTESTR